MNVKLTMLSVAAAIGLTGAVATSLPSATSAASDGTRLGSLGRNSIVYTKAQADEVFLRSVSMDGYAKTNDIPTRTSQLSNDSGFITGHQSLDGYATMEADLDKGTLRIAARREGQPDTFFMIFCTNGCPAIAAGVGDMEDFGTAYVYGGPTIDGMTNSLWQAIGQTYTKSEVKTLVASAISAVAGPFAIAEGADGRPTLVRRSEGEIEGIVDRLLEDAGALSKQNANVQE